MISAGTGPDPVGAGAGFPPQSKGEMYDIEDSFDKRHGFRGLP